MCLSLSCSLADRDLDNDSVKHLVTVHEELIFKFLAKAEEADVRFSLNSNVRSNLLVDHAHVALLDLEDAGEV